MANPLTALENEKRILQQQLHNDIEMKASMVEDAKHNRDILESGIQLTPNDIETLNWNIEEDTEGAEDIIERIQALRARIKDIDTRINAILHPVRGEGLIPKKTIRKGGVVYYGTRSVKG